MKNSLQTGINGKGEGSSPFQLGKCHPFAGGLLQLAKWRNFYDAKFPLSSFDREKRHHLLNII